MAKAHMRLTLNSNRHAALKLAKADCGISFEHLMLEILDDWLRAKGYMRWDPKATNG